MHLKFDFLAFSILIFLFLVSNQSIASIYHVSNDGGDFNTLQEAIKFANSGDIVKVHSGIYHETVTIAKDNLTIEAYDPQNPPVFDGSDQQFLNTNQTWIYEYDDIYSTPYTWVTNIPELNHYGGGKNGYSTLVVYENDIYLRLP